MKVARRPPLPAAVVCPAGGRRRRRLAITADLTGNPSGGEGEEERERNSGSKGERES
jgi:hypothetical protein